MCISAGYFQAAASSCIALPFKGGHMMHSKEVTEEEKNRIIQLPSKIITGRKKKAVHEPNSANGTGKKSHFLPFYF